MKPKQKGLLVVSSFWILVGICCWKPLILFGILGFAAVLGISWLIYDSVTEEDWS